MINQVDNKMSKLGEATMQQLTNNTNVINGGDKVKLIEKFEKVLLMNQGSKKQSHK